MSRKTKTFSQKATSSVLAFLIIFQTMAGIFLPFKISPTPPYVEIQETHAAGENWMTGWSYRRAITIADSQTDFQTKVEIQGSSASSPNYVDFTKILAGGADVRFTDSGGLSALHYWIESWDDTGGSEAATIWVRTHGTTATPMYMYYGKAGETTTSNYDNTFTKDYGESGLIGLWHMEDGNGTTVTENSGGGANNEFSLDLRRGLVRTAVNGTGRMFNSQQEIV